MSEKVKVWIMYILITVIWGTTWLMIKVSLESFPPLIGSSIRFMVASVILGLAVWIKKLPLPLTKRAIAVYVYMGLFSCVFPFWFVNWGEKYVASGMAAVLFALYPFAIVIATRLGLPDEKISLIKVIGLIIGFSGIVTIFSDSFNGTFNNNMLGMAAILGSAVLQATVAVFVKRYGSDINPISLNFVPMFIGAVGSLLLALVFEDKSQVHPSWQGFGSVVYLGVFGSVVAFTAYYWLLKRMNIVILSFSSFITPIVALLVGWIFLNEYLNKNHFYGSFLVLIGLLITNVTFTRRKKVLAD